MLRAPALKSALKRSGRPKLASGESVLKVTMGSAGMLVVVTSAELVRSNVALKLVDRARFACDAVMTGPEGSGLKLTSAGIAALNAIVTLRRSKTSSRELTWSLNVSGLRSGSLHSRFCAVTVCTR